MTYLYALKDPDTGSIRYIGKSGSPHKRYKSHIRDWIREKTHKSRWIGTLLDQGKSPVLEILDKVPVSEWEFWEREYIQWGHLMLFPLTNGTVGGEGAALFGPSNPLFGRHGPAHPKFGKPLSEDTRKKMSLAKVGVRLTEGHRHKISLSQKGKSKSETTRKKMSESRRLYLQNKEII